MYFISTSSMPCSTQGAEENVSYISVIHCMQCNFVIFFVNACHSLWGSTWLFILWKLSNLHFVEGNGIELPEGPHLTSLPLNKVYLNILCLQRGL